MSFDTAVLEWARCDLGLTTLELWLDYFSLGGDASAREIEGFLTGRTRPSHRDYDLLAVALNDEYVDRGQEHPVPYATRD